MPPLDCSVRQPYIGLQNTCTTVGYEPPTGLPALEQAIDAFIDNTTLIIGGQTKSYN